VRADGMHDAEGGIGCGGHAFIVSWSGISAEMEVVR
jgi:hypothetical protein